MMHKLLSPALALLLLLALPAGAPARPGDLGPVSVLGRGGTDLSGAAVVLQGDGRATVAGSRDGRGFLVVRLRPDGSRDPSFGRHGAMTVRFRGASGASAHAVALFRDGRVLVAGTVTIGGARRFAAARLLPRGGLDPNFGSGGAVVTGPVGA